MHQRAAKPGVSVRGFSPEDLPDVLELLDASLGGGPAGRRPPEFFRWKHLDNPFGPSYLLLATASERLVGLRAFLRWRFLAGDRAVGAVRAVDTATHPGFQGMGIFTRLTLAAVDDLRDQVDLVFNTPNGKSGPGYLKMGWTEVGRVPVRIRARRPLRVLRGRRDGATAGQAPAVDAPAAAAVLERGPEVTGLLAREPAPAGLATARDLAYLRWRYGPFLADYRAVTDDDAGLAIFRLTKRGRLNEGTVCGLIAPNRQTATALIKRVARSAPFDYLTTAVPLARARLVRSPIGGRLLGVAPYRGQIQPDPTKRVSWALTLGDLERLELC